MCYNLNSNKLLRIISYNTPAIMKDTIRHNPDIDIDKAEKDLRERFIHLLTVIETRPPSEMKSLFNQWLQDCDRLQDEKFNHGLIKPGGERYPDSIGRYYFGALRAFVNLQRKIDGEQ